MDTGYLPVIVTKQPLHTTLYDPLLLYSQTNRNKNVDSVSVSALADTGTRIKLYQKFWNQ